MESNACLQGPCTSNPIAACLQLHHDYPSYVTIVPWWQNRYLRKWVNKDLPSYVYTHICTFMYLKLLGQPGLSEPHINEV